MEKNRPNAQQGICKKQAFVAIKFGEQTNKTREAIRTAIQQCGYTARIIDEKEHNKHRTQRIGIHYRFIDTFALPEERAKETYVADTRQGVAVEYLPIPGPAQAPQIGHKKAAT